MAAKIRDTGSNNTIKAPADTSSGECLIAVDGNNNSVIFSEESACLVESTIEIRGNDNVIVFGEQVVLRGRCGLTIEGDGNRVEMGERSNGQIGANLHTSNGTLRIGDESTFVDVQITLHEPGLVELGRDCMLSAGVWIANSDMHAIVDLKSGERLNPPRDVVIGDHVWLGYDCKILKGTTIGSGSVIATGAVVTQAVPPNSLVAGVPAKLKRRNIAWSREFVPADGAQEP